MFAICAYLNEEVTNFNNRHVDITSSIKITKTTRMHFKSIVCTYRRLSKWCVLSRLFSESVGLISIPLRSSTKFMTCCPLNNCKRATRSLSEIGQLLSLFFFFCLLVAHLLILLMNGKVYPNPGPIFTLSVCASNMARSNRSVPCCTCSK